MKDAPHHHLVVLQHGNHGKAEDLLLLQQELQDILRKDVALEQDTSYHYLRPGSNEGNKTHDGIETLAARVVREIDEYIAQNIHENGCIYLTMVAHSLGMAQLGRSKHC